jgi:hypothetical protein
VQLPEAVPTAHATVTAFVMQSEDGLLQLFGSHATPVYAVADGVRYIVSPTAALLYAVSKFWVRTVVLHPDAPAVLLKPLAQLVQDEAPAREE